MTATPLSLLELLTGRMPTLAAVCRRLELDPAKVLRAVRVVLGLEAMPVAEAIAPWEEVGCGEAAP